MVHKLIDCLDNFYSTSAYRKRNYVKFMRERSGEYKYLARSNSRSAAISDIRDKIHSDYLFSGLDVIEKWRDYNCLNISSILEQSHGYDDRNYLDDYLHAYQYNKYSRLLNKPNPETETRLDSTKKGRVEEPADSSKPKKTSVCISQNVTSIQDLLDIIEKNPLSRH